jgi:hypothetical protein
MEAERQQSGTSSVGEESETADAHEGGRQHMQQKSAQELISKYRIDWRCEVGHLLISN